jgi:hypothetical protein
MCASCLAIGLLLRQFHQCAYFKEGIHQVKTHTGEKGWFVEVFFKTGDIDKSRDHANKKLEHDAAVNRADKGVGIGTLQAFFAQQKANEGNYKKEEVANDQDVLVGAPPVQYIFTRKEKRIQYYKYVKNGQEAPKLLPGHCPCCF